MKMNRDLFWAGIILAVSVLCTARAVRLLGGERASAVFSFSVNKRVVMIDAGHGGWDPGKTGRVGEDEKNINLKIAENLQMYLENSGAVTVVTRLTDEAAGDGKRSDLRNRKNLADSSRADIIISIHQNSYPQESVKGAQVFYHDDAEKSRVLAEFIQASINSFADPNNKRLAKENPDYYILKQTAAPAVIVECGFLSNYSDEKRLNTEEYQEKMAWAIYAGILDYFNNERVENSAN